MATEIVTTVKASGGDYSSLAAWEAGEQGDLVTADEIHTAACYGMQDTTQCTIDGSTTDATRYMRIVAASGAEAAMPMPTDGSRYFLRGAAPSDAMLKLSDGYCLVERIAVENTSTGSSLRAVQFTDVAGAVNQRLDRCFLRVGASGTVFACLLARGPYGPTTEHRTTNCVIINLASGSGHAVTSDETNNQLFYNCTVVAAGTGRRAFSGIRNTHKVINCLAYVTSGAEGFVNAAGWATGSDYNASSDATAPGANSRQSQTFTFVNAAGGDYHLASGDGGAKDFGTDLSATFTVDFDGQTRPTGAGTWDIGADEVVAAGGTTLTVADLTVAAAFDAPALTQAGQLAIADLLVAAAFDAPALTQAHQLAVADLLVAAGLEVPALTQAHVLAVAALSVAGALDTIALTQAHQLTVADLLVAAGLEAPALTQANTLAVADLDVAVTLEPVTLATGTLLQIADLAVAAALDGVVLTQAHQLAVANLLVAAGFDTPALVQAHVLTVGDLAVAVALDGVVLVLPATFDRAIFSAFTLTAPRLAAVTLTGPQLTGVTLAAPRLTSLTLE